MLLLTVLRLVKKSNRTVRHLYLSGIMVSMNHREPVTVVFDRKVRPGKEKDYEAWHKELIKLSQTTGGHLATHVVHHGGRYITIQQFDSRPTLDAWLDSPKRAAKLAEMHEFVEDAPEPQALSGLESWFQLPEYRQVSSHPVRWKQALVTLGAIYVLVLLLNILVMPYIIGWPLLIRSAVFPIVIVPLLVYVIMPRLTRLLRGWLFS